MRIRWRLTLQFASLVAILLIFFSFSVYYFSSSYRERQFHGRLKERATNSVKLLLQVKEVDSTLLKIIDRNTQGLVDERIIVFNEKNVEIYDNGVEDTIPVRSQLLQKIRHNGEMEFTEGRRESYAKAINVKGGQYVVIASAFDKFGKDKLANLELILLLVFLTGVTLAFAGGFFYSGAALQPISSVINQVNNISATSLHQRLDEGNQKDEIESLSMTFNKMLSRLEASFEMQKRFISNVSHEIRTPMTYILGEIELMKMEEKNSEEIKNFILSLEHDIKATNNLLNNLLLLAQASMDMSTIRFEPVRIDELLLTSRIDVLRNHPAYKIIINFVDLPEELNLLNIPANEKLLKSAFMNLMDNGCKFSFSKEVIVLMTATPKQLVIKFADRGIGIKQEDLDKVRTEPFFRGSNAKEFEGNGIGLPLTNKILTLHRGTLDIESKLNFGSTFTITLPFA
jgi:signal transduction histidine kinase